MEHAPASDTIAAKKEIILKRGINISGAEVRKAPLPSAPLMVSDVSRFREALEKSVSPAFPARDLITVIVSTALETEFGKTFTLMRGFDKMVRKLSDAMMTDPVLRRQALSVVSAVLEKKAEREKKAKNG